jgi:DNA ligase-4
VWAETKCDGERAQIHVEVNADGSSRITIFSKSKRDSTHDRHAVHYIIRKALDLRDDYTHSGRTGRSKIKHNIILDAEMVAFNGTQVDGIVFSCYPESLVHGFTSRVLENKKADREYCVWYSWSL